MSRWMMPRLWASRSADAKVRVGACLLDHFHRVVGVGYNGRDHDIPGLLAALRESSEVRREPSGV